MSTKSLPPEHMELLLEKVAAIGQAKRVMIPAGALVEAFGGELLLEGAKFDEATNSILDVTLIAVGWSLNNRYYSAEALRGAVALFEGQKGYINHDQWSYSRDMRDLCCKFSDVYFDEGTQKLKAGRMRVFRSTPNAWVYGLSKEDASQVGLSIVVDGQVTQGLAPDGRTGNLVAAILRAYSCDVVPEPAAGGGVDDPATEAVSEERETPVDLKEATLDQLKKERPDLFEAAVAQAKPAEDTVKTAVAAALAEQQTEASKTVARVAAVDALLEASGLAPTVVAKLRPAVVDLSEATAKVIIDGTKDALAEAAAASARPPVRDAGSSKPEEGADGTKAAEAVTKYSNFMDSAFGVPAQQEAK